MANPTDVITNAARVVVTPTESFILLDPSRRYAAIHLGVAENGDAATSTVFYKPVKSPNDAGSVADTYASGTDRGCIISGGATMIGPNVPKVYLKTPAAGSSPVVQITEYWIREVR